MGDKMWSEKDGGIHCVTDSSSCGDSEKFTVEWHADGKLAIKTASGKYLAQAMNKYLKPTASGASEDERSLFTHSLVNRPRLVLRGTEGFINTLPSGLLECNKSEAEFYKAQYKDGKIAITGKTDKYWKVGENGISVIRTHPNTTILSSTRTRKWLSNFKANTFSLLRTAPSLRLVAVPMLRHSLNTKLPLILLRLR